MSSSRKRKQNSCDNNTSHEDFVSKPKKQKKKKNKSNDELQLSATKEETIQQPTECSEVYGRVPVDASSSDQKPTSTLDLMKLIKNREVIEDRKVQVIYEFVESTSGLSGFSFSNGLVPPSHFVASLSEWIQGLIISASKLHPLSSLIDGKQKVTLSALLEQMKVPAHLDVKYWAILKWCLCFGIQWKLGGVSLGLVQALSRVLSDTSIIVSRYEQSLNNAKTVIDNDGITCFISAFLPMLRDVVKLLLSTYESLFRPKLDVWISFTTSCLNMSDTFCSLIEGSNYCTTAVHTLLEIINRVLRGFVDFLRSSPNHRKAFQAVVEKILEKLMRLRMDLSIPVTRVLDVQIQAEKSKLLNAIQDILKYSLFHPSHIGGFLNVCKYSRKAEVLHIDGTEDDNEDESRSKGAHVSASLLSYHKLLFQQIENFIKEDKLSSLGSMAWLLKCYVQGVRAQETLSSPLYLVKGKSYSKDFLPEKVSVIEDQNLESGKNQFHRKQDAGANDFFPMFAELVSSIFKDLDASSYLSHVNDGAIVGMLRKLRLTLNATSDLFQIAIEEHIYKPTEDTNHTNLSFMKEIYRNIIQFSTTISKVYCELRSGNMEMHSLLLAVMSQLILAIGYILELDYRVLENDLEEVWMTIVFSAALKLTLPRNIQNSIQVNAVEDNGVHLASRLVVVFGELRQAERSIFNLCHFLRNISWSESSLPESLQLKLQRKALESVFLSENFLTAVMSVVNELPEGQVAPFTRLLVVDMEETVKQIQRFDYSSKHQQLQAATIKVLTEIYICILEHQKVTASNSIQFGAAVRDVMDRIVSPLLTVILESSTMEGNTITNYVSLLLSKFKDVTNLKQKNEDSKVIKSLILQSCNFTLRLYMTVKCLHRQSVSLMPSKQARKASRGINDSLLLFTMEEFSRVDPLLSKDCFFACSGFGSTSVVDTLCGIRQWIEEAGQEEATDLQYILDCIAVQSLDDTKKQLRASSFILSQSELTKPTMFEKQDSEDTSEIDSGLNVLLETEKKALRKLSKKLKRKASSLTRFLIKWIENSNKDLKQDAISGIWNRVVGCLNSQTLTVARWGLLCQNIDIWSDFASVDDLKLFIHFLLESTLKLDDDHEESTVCNVFSLTRDLLHNPSFYEQKAIRDLLLKTVCEKVDNNLDLSKFSYSIKDSMSYIEAKLKDVGGCLSVSEVFKDLDNGSTKWNPQNMKITESIQLMNLVQKIPNGYIDGQSATSFISFTLMLERTIVMWLVNFKNCFKSKDSAKVLLALELLISCRRTLESLILKEDIFNYSNDYSYISMPIFLLDSGSMCWFLLSFRAVASSFYALMGQVDEAVPSGNDILMSFSKCTIGLFTFFSECLIQQNLKGLMLRCEDSQFPESSECTANPLFTSFIETMSNQLRDFNELLKSTTGICFSGLSRQQTIEELYMKNGNLSQENSYVLVTMLSAIGSILWGVTRTLESFDDRCHLDKGGSLKWSGRLHNDLLSFIENVELFLTDKMHEMLQVDKDASKKSTNFEMTTDIHLENASDASDIDSDNEGSIEDNGDVPVDDLGNTSVTLEPSDHDVEIYHENDSDSDDAAISEPMIIGGSVKVAHIEGSPLRELSSKTIIRKPSGKSSHRFGGISELSEAQVLMIRQMTSGSMETTASLIGELFMAMSAIVRLKGLFNSPNLHKSSVRQLDNNNWTSEMSFYGGAANRILKEFLITSKPGDRHWLILVLGTIKYMESLGTFLPYSRPILGPTAFMSLINTQMSTYESLLSKNQFMEIDDIKCSLRSSFMMFLKKPIGFHFHLILRAVECSLLGINNGNMEKHAPVNCINEVNPSPTKVAAVEYLSICLEAVSGVKRLQILSRYFHRYLAAIFNFVANDQVLWHGFCQSKEFPPIVLRKSINILVSISSREVIFPMKPHHIAQAMSFPADIFRPFYQRNIQQVKLMQNLNFSTEEFGMGYKCLLPDDPFILNELLEIYTSSCKLLRNLLRHRQRESGRCATHLGDSLRSMLFFLEVVQISISWNKCCAHLSMKFAAQCAAWLRRVYEEVAEHKDILATYLTHLLSDYICIISGYGMTASGLSREIEAVLRPGAYAILDACSSDDLQQLHAVLGEGPRRSALTSLRRDYEQHFKYTGKV